MTDEETKGVEEVSKGSEGKVYELGHLLVPTIKEEEISVVYGNLKDLILSLNGKVVADEMPKMIGLAYPMTKVVSNIRSKFNTAYFGWVKFTMSPSGILELKKKLDLDTNIIRFLLIKTVKENTIAAKRFVRGDMAHRRAPSAKKNEDGAEVAPIDKAEIDKEIDAMVAV
ncbi:MAG: 30S ribosomal protein S6 [Candidatus Pacebacteria bacterium]|nr:30S ribosomal protein S6 [Candidatus Paceibacterota bacterium]